MELYLVKVSAEVVVAADSEQDALRQARLDMDSIKEGEFFDIGDATPLADKALPSGWDINCVPYGDFDGLTIKELANAGSAKREGQ